MRALVVICLLLTSLLLTSCIPYTPAQRAEFIDITVEKSTEKMKALVADMGDKLQGEMHDAIIKRAAELDLSEAAAKKLAESLPPLVNELATKLVNEKAPEVVRKTMEEVLPEGQEPGGGALAGLMTLLVQAGLAAAKG